MAADSQTPSPHPGRPARPSAVTIHDVAALAGVSLITVSRAMNEPHRLAPATLEKVQAAVARTGYVPNLMAGSLRSAKTRLVVALVPTTTGLLFAGMINSLGEALRARGIQLMIGESGYAPQGEDDLLRAIIGRRPEGIFLTGVMHSEAGRRALLASGIPIVETWDDTEQPVDMLVSVAQEALGREVCRFLHARGRRHLALISGDDARAVRRCRGFQQAAAELGLPPPVLHVETPPTTHAQGRAAIRALQAGRAGQPPIDGVFCGSDLLAMGVMTECRATGIDVPGQLSVVGFGDLDFAASLLPALTTVKIDGEAIGHLAAAMLADRSEGREVATPRVDVGFTMIERDSA